ncbi:MAG: hypothetical protein LBQ24_03370 [Candidatus Peribacteria bacterium]|nr:hypothetical protein [Candidatus Peribacteria bacterium]
MLIVSLIFLYFIFQTNSLELKEIDIFSTEAFKWLVASITNIILLLISVILY